MGMPSERATRRLSLSGDERWVRRHKIGVMKEKGFKLKKVAGEPITRGGKTKGHNRVEEASVYLMYKPEPPKETPSKSTKTAKNPYSGSQ